MFRTISLLVLTAMLTITSNVAMAALNVERVEYKGWQNCYRVSNGEVELIVTGDVGPRIIRYGFVGGQNLLKEYPEQLGKSGETKFQLRGGSRVWKSPEDPIASWAPDNVPVKITPTPTGLIALAPTETVSSLQKEIEISMAPSGTEVTVYNRITNRSVYDLTFAPWVLTMMAPGGTAIAAFPPRGTHEANLAPTNPLTMWAYTDLSDKRWTFTKKYLSLRQDPKNPEPQKLAFFNVDSWAAYLLNGEAFIKRAKADPTKTYPDYGCSFETFTNNEFLEVETVGALSTVAPGKTVEQVEHWTLHRNVKLTEVTDEAIDRAVLPLVRAGEGAK